MVTTLLLFTICLMGIYICYMYIHIYKHNRRVSLLVLDIK